MLTMSSSGRRNISNSESGNPLFKGWYADLGSSFLTSGFTIGFTPLTPLLSKNSCLWMHFHPLIW